MLKKRFLQCFCGVHRSPYSFTSLVGARQMELRRSASHPEHTNTTRHVTFEEFKTLPFDDLMQHHHTHHEQHTRLLPPISSLSARSSLSSSLHSAPVSRRSSFFPQIAMPSSREIRNQIESDLALLMDGLLRTHIEHSFPLVRRRADEFPDDSSDIGFSYEQLLALDNNNTPRGTPASVLASLPVFKASQAHTSTQCAVCMDNFTAGAPITKLACNHMYCKDCITKWLQVSKQCPTCRREVC